MWGLETQLVEPGRHWCRQKRFPKVLARVSVPVCPHDHSSGQMTTPDTARKAPSRLLTVCLGPKFTL